MIHDRILVLGIGNILMNDEGVGIRVVTQLEKEGFTDAELVDGGTGGFHLLGMVQSYQTVVLIDASLDEFPVGNVRVLQPRFAHDFPHQLSAHEVGLKALIDAAIATGNLPKIYLIAISIRNFQDMGLDLSPEVEAAIPATMAKVKEIVTNLNLNLSKV
jgi:hydrogenase maturation protease